MKFKFRVSPRVRVNVRMRFLRLEAWDYQPFKEWTKEHRTKDRIIWKKSMKVDSLSSRQMKYEE